MTGDTLIQNIHADSHLSRPPPTDTRRFTLRVLVVEGDVTVRKLTAMVMTRAGYEVDTAEDGEAGWEAVQTTRYDLLVTDHEMPQMTGLELVERLRLAGLTVPVIMVSGSSELGETGDHPGLALEAILHKPFHFADLIDAANRIAPVVKPYQKDR